MNAVEQTEHVLGLCREAGFALAGVADASPSRRRAEFEAWLGAGKHGSMAWLEETAALRSEPARIMEGTRSLIMVADAYTGPDPGGPPLPASHGRVACYARGNDYHVVMKRRLHHACDALRERFPGEEFRSFVDTAPVAERELAHRAGIGWVGKHTLIIHPRLGSYLLLGGFATTMTLEPPAHQRVIDDHCGTCTRCIDACPTGAITPYSVDARRCISYLTIEHRGPIDTGLHAPMEDRVFGCDACQEVCPHNGGGRPGPVRAAYAPQRTGFDLATLLGWAEEDRRRAFERSAMKRASLSTMRRNAAIAAGNALARAEDAALRARLEAVAADPAQDAAVRAAARSATERSPRR